MLGRFWRSSKVTCQYPERSGQKKGVEGKDTINLQMAQDIYKLFEVIVPVGSGSFSIIICSCVCFHLPFELKWLKIILKSLIVCEIMDGHQSCVFQRSIHLNCFSKN